MTAPEVKHGYTAYNKGRCRCDVCRAAATARMREVRAERRKYPVPATVKHGTANAWDNYSCRCDKCHRFALARSRRDSARRKASTPPPHVHGTLTGYTGWYCRCRPCGEAAHDYEQRRKASV